MKTNRLYTLTTMALETIKMIETEMKQDKSSTESIWLALQKARQTCETWTMELKSVQAADLVTVADFFLLLISHIITQQITNEQIFQEEQRLLNLVDDFLECGGGHPDLVPIKLKSNYYRALVYITQQKNQVNTMIAHLNTILTFQSDQPIERCRQIKMLDNLSIGCATLINQSDLKGKDQDKISEIATQLMHKTMDIYDSVPASEDLPGWDRSLTYGNLMLHSLSLVLRHFIELSLAPEKAKSYQMRMENLLVRLQVFLSRYQRLSPPESDCQLILELLVNFLQSLKLEDVLLRKSLTTIARDFAPDVASPAVLAYRAAIIAFEQSVEEKLSIQEQSPPALLRIIEQTSVQKYVLDRTVPKIKTTHLAELAPQVLKVIEQIDPVARPKAGSEKTLKQQSLTEPVEQKELIEEAVQAVKKVCEFWLEKSSLCKVEDMLVVVKFLLKRVAHTIVKAPSPDIFQQEKQLLDLIDQILAGNNHHSDLIYAQFHSKYYRVLCYMTQQRYNIDDIVAHGNATLAFHCDKISDRYQQIQVLDSLCNNGLSWIDDPSLTADQCNKMLEWVSDLVQTIADIYESTPASASSPGSCSAEMHSNLVVRTIAIILYHFKTTLYTPETADLYHHRIEKLLTRLQAATNKHAYPPQEKECLNVLTMIIDILQKFDQQNYPWLVQLVKTAEKFVPDTAGPQVLACQIMIASFKKSHSRMKGNPSVPLIESKFVKPPALPKRLPRSLPKMVNKKEDNHLAEDNQKLRRQIQAAQQTAKKQRQALVKKNKKLSKQLEKQAQEKTTCEQLLNTKTIEWKQLADESTQLQTALSETQHRSALLIQQQVELSQEKRLALKEQKRQEVTQQEQETDWNQQIREQ
ncbi:MAG: hypothetical protein JSR33_06475, partial [Proteobacteria bacterium]|nr:hypothetical protein [Pseudomonadota bacterium]